MPVIIISSAAFSREAEITARTAGLLGYRIAGPEVLAAAAQRHGVPEERLRQAINESATWRSMSAKDRRVCLAVVGATLSDCLLDGECVCHGLAAHLYVTGISHVVKVRVACPLDSRAARAALQENLSDSRARKLVRRLDTTRRRWVEELFGVDENDPANFDIVIEVERTGIEEAATLIVDVARRRRYQPMSYSLKQMRDHALASKVRAALVDVDPGVVVRANDGNVRIETKVLGTEGEKTASLRSRALAVPGSLTVEVAAIDDYFARAAMSMR